MTILSTPDKPTPAQSHHIRRHESVFPPNIFSIKHAVHRARVLFDSITCYVHHTDKHCVNTLTEFSADRSIYDTDEESLMDTGERDIVYTSPAVFGNNQWSSAGVVRRAFLFYSFFLYFFIHRDRETFPSLLRPAP